MSFSQVKALAKKHFKKKDDNTSKYDYGRCLIVGGSYKYVGAPKFASLGMKKIIASTKACMLVGTGLSYVALPGILAKFALEYVEYSGVIRLPHKFGNILFTNKVCKRIMKNINAVVVGPGINKANSKKFIKYVLDKTHATIVIDAEAIKNISTLSFNNSAVITPNEKEINKLLGTKTYTNEMVKKFAQEHNCTIVLKGHNSYITDGENEYFNFTGNAKLAKGGSGDVLSGIIGGLLAMNLPPFDSAVLGSYILGRSAELTLQNEYSVLAIDVINMISKAIDELICI